jgi:hypothetical protein
MTPANQQCLARMIIAKHACCLLRFSHRSMTAVSVFSFFGCRVGRHQPLRRDVTWDGRHYVGTCRHCGEPVQRHGHRDWRKRDD